MSHITQFLSLPIELKSMILGFLDEIDLLTCTAVARQLRELITDSSKFQYTIELAKRRMVCVIPASATLPCASRLSTLRNREQAWRMLNWKSWQRLKIPPSGSIYEFVDGLYATGKEDDNRVTRSISFWELPAPRDTSDKSELPSWTHSMEDVTIIDFAMDPAQDLLVLVTLAPASSKYLCEIHLRSITTNETHPKALIPKLSCLSGSAGTTPYHLTSVRIQILGDLVALLVKASYNNPSSHLEIWDWVKNPQVSCKMKSKSGIEDFTFLSNDTFLIVRTTGSLETCTFANPITNSSRPISQYNYVFPQLSDEYVYWYMTISSNPTPVPVPQSGPSRDRCKRLYSPKPTERIYVCSLCVSTPEAVDVHTFSFFFNPQILLHPPTEWKEAARKVRRRRVSSHHYTCASPRISIQPLPSVSLPITQPHSDISLQPSLSLASPAFHNTTASSSSSSMAFPSSSSSISTVLTIPNASAPSDPDPAPISGSKPLKVAHGPIVIPWDAWGPPTTRWFRECVNTDWQYSVHGLRTVDSVRVECLPFSLGREGDGDGDGDGNGGKYKAGYSTSAIDPPSAPDDTDNDESELSVPPRYLRLRDYNPYSIREGMQLEELERRQGRNDKNKAKANWRGPCVVTHPTTTDVNGVFTHDIVSQLPYVEVLSKEPFRVTDVMMDDCRLLLHKRGRDGILERVDVLTM